MSDDTHIPRPKQLCVTKAMLDEDLQFKQEFLQDPPRPDIIFVAGYLKEAAYWRDRYRHAFPQAKVPEILSAPNAVCRLMGRRYYKLFICGQTTKERKEFMFWCDQNNIKWQWIDSLLNDAVGRPNSPVPSVCPFDTDGDGNCHRHPQGCSNHQTP